MWRQWPGTGCCRLLGFALIKATIINNEATFMRLGNIDFVVFFESLHITHLCISSTGGLFRLEHNTFNAWSHAKEFCQKVSSTKDTFQWYFLCFFCQSHILYRYITCCPILYFHYISMWYEKCGTSHSTRSFWDYALDIQQPFAVSSPCRVTIEQNRLQLWHPYSSHALHVLMLNAMTSNLLLDLSCNLKAKAFMVSREVKET